MNNEEEFQKRAEAGMAGDDMDSKAYDLVFSALKAEPDMKLPTSFADRVAQMVVKNKAESASLEFIWLVAGIVSLLIALIITASMIDVSMDFGFLSAMKSYRGLLVFAAIFIGLLHWVDKRFVHQKRAV